MVLPFKGAQKHLQKGVCQNWTFTFNVPSPSAVSMRQMSDKTQFAVEPVLLPILSDSGRLLIISHISTINPKSILV